jgi:perosamine synthetase
VKRSRIHSAGPDISDLEIEYVNDAIRNGWYDNFSGYIEKFEKAFADYIGLPFALATSHGTGALHLSLAANGIGPGDEVIVPDISWVATANVVRHCGAEPVFVDVRLDDWNIDPDTIEAAITPQTRAIFPVHLYGHPADMDEICRIADKHNLIVVEDAAPSAGSMYRGKSPGTFGQGAGFSFQGAKMMATGQGGMFVCGDDEVFRRAVALSEHGRDATGGVFYSAHVGFNYKISNLAAAMGLAQLERVNALLAHKAKLRDWYFDRLTSIDGIFPQIEGPGASANWSYPSVRFDRKLCDRDTLLARLKQRGIDSRPAFPRMSTMPAFETAETPRAAEIAATGINLPTAAYLDEQDVEEICEALLELIGTGVHAP